MTCTEIQKQIYLFNELKADQQQMVMVHISACPACKHTFDEAANGRQLIEKIAREPQQLDDALKFTNQVMGAVHFARRSPEHKSFIDALMDFLSLRLMKYSMGALSIIFIGLFLLELTGNPEPIHQIQQMPATSADVTELNTTSFFQQFQKIKAEGQAGSSIVKCLIECRHTARLNCSSCRTKYLTLFNHNEKI
jgi:hypothetical protein